MRIRNRERHFAWLGVLAQHERDRFYGELTQLLVGLPVLGHACVIDRPGYNLRYKERFGDKRWSLCKTAFSIVVERSAKLAHRESRKLNVFVEKSDRKVDRWIAEYFDGLKKEGMPFARESSSKYEPLTCNELGGTLYDLKMKDKSSPMIQLADLYIYPLCRAGYEPAYRSYVDLRESCRIIDSGLTTDERLVLGVKYSCFPETSWAGAKKEPG